MKVISIIALVGGWDEEDLSKAIGELTTGMGWSRMTSIASDLDEPLGKFREDISRIMEEKRRQQEEAVNVAALME